MRDDIFIRTCKMCGKEFIASRPNTQFCGMVKNMKAAAERLMSLPWNTMTYEAKDVLRQVKNVAYQQKMSFAKKGDHDGNVA